ncbi:MAG: hypothetical protein ABW170_16355 [Candidatus Thiodiazotropha sp. L084R]
MLALYPLWRKARRVYSLTSRLPGTNRLGFQPSLALSERRVRPAAPCREWFIRRNHEKSFDINLVCFYYPL